MNVGERGDDVVVGSVEVILIYEFYLGKNRNSPRPILKIILLIYAQNCTGFQLTGITLMSDTPDPVSLKSLSLSGSDDNLTSDLFFSIDFDLLCVSFVPSGNIIEKIFHLSK